VGKPICVKELMGLPQSSNININSILMRMRSFFFAVAAWIVLKCCTMKTTAICSFINDWTKENFIGPELKEEIRQLSHQQLRWLLEGISIDQPKAIRSGKKGIF